MFFLNILTNSWVEKKRMATFVGEASECPGKSSHFSMLSLGFFFFPLQLLIALWPSADPSPSRSSLPPRTHTQQIHDMHAGLTLSADTRRSHNRSSPAADRRQNDSDSSRWCISATRLTGYLCANYSRHTSRARESSFCLNREAWPSCSKSTANNLLPPLPFLPARSCMLISQSSGPPQLQLTGTKTHHVLWLLTFCYIFSKKK